MRIGSSKKSDARRSALSTPARKMVSPRSERSIRLPFGRSSIRAAEFAKSA